MKMKKGKKMEVRKMKKEKIRKKILITIRKKITNREMKYQLKTGRIKDNKLQIIPKENESSTGKTTIMEEEIRIENQTGKIEETIGTDGGTTKNTLKRGRRTKKEKNWKKRSL